MPKKPPKKAKVTQYYEAIGRRKTAVARVRLHIVGSGKTATVASHTLKGGQILVNDKAIETIYSHEGDRLAYEAPLTRTENKDRFAITIRVAGGGKRGQLQAITLGLARALEKVDGALRPLLKSEGFLTADARARQRRKVGTGGKARRQKQSPKR